MELSSALGKDYSVGDHSLTTGVGFLRSYFPIATTVASQRDRDRAGMEWDGKFAYTLASLFMIAVDHPIAISSSHQSTEASAFWKTTA